VIPALYLSHGAPPLVDDAVSATEIDSDRAQRQLEVHRGAAAQPCER